jgi:hypothetical protein
VSPICTLSKDATSWDRDTWRIRLRTLKSGEPVYLPIPDNLKLVLDALPLPRNAAKDCSDYFWNGQTSRRAVVGIAERTLAAVFQEVWRKKCPRTPVPPHPGDSSAGKRRKERAPASLPSGRKTAEETSRHAYGERKQQKPQIYSGM